MSGPAGRRRYPLPRWIAHRGGGGLAPENTLAGFRLAARLGFRAAEFDVMLTRDGVPVLMHDETLARTTGAAGAVADLDWADLARLDAGARFHKSWAGEAIPRLDAVLALCADLGLGLNVEIKPATGHEARTGEVVAALVAARWPAGLPLLVSSFCETALAAAQEAVPGQARALLFETVPADWAERLARLGCLALHARAADLDGPTVAAVTAAGVPVAAYTVNSAAEADRCFALGVSALFTDRLDGLGPV